MTTLENYQEEDTVSRQIGCSIKEMDFASSIWKITKICDSVSRETTPRRDSFRQIGCSIKEMDFASSIWKITKICDSVSQRDNSKKRQFPDK
ncbi:hypothetical protein CEXT_682991 [Caerostris extrusa]|uniref:Uncharacterized protein n=1 Tax=Caerostris extrusa TaxID=172846 RepID=A0AAV4V8V1_CAEEX|nr:hypothetical protein CEXT_682991 [Caerostris extrusa]